MAFLKYLGGLWQSFIGIFRRKERVELQTGYHPPQAQLPGTFPATSPFLPKFEEGYGATVSGLNTPVPVTLAGDLRFSFAAPVAPPAWWATDPYTVPVTQFTNPYATAPAPAAWFAGRSYTGPLSAHLADWPTVAPNPSPFLAQAAWTGPSYTGPAPTPFAWPIDPYAPAPVSIAGAPIPASAALPLSGSFGHSFAYTAIEKSYLAPPLFPKGEDVKIKQGRVGDCYLLASLSAILRHPQGRAHVESMFQTLADGTVIVKIKSNAFSTHLLKKVSDGFLEGKYKFRQEGGYDIFIISPERLAEINRSAEVDTNAVAVKILERLSSYYHTSDWKRMPELMPARYADPISLLAHDLNEARFEESNPAGFVAAILGMDARVVNINDAGGVNFLKLFKQQDPSYPVYLSMANKPGPGRHAYQLADIKALPPLSNHYQVYLVDPYDNNKVVQFPLEEIQSREPRCFVYDVPTKAPALNRVWHETKDFNMLSKAPEASEERGSSFFGYRESEVKGPELLLREKLHEILKDSVAVGKFIDRFPLPQRSHVRALLDGLRRHPGLIDEQVGLLKRNGFLPGASPVIMPAPFESLRKLGK